MLAINNLRKGSKYSITNNGDSCVFEVLEFLGKDNYRIKDIGSLEVITLDEFLRWGTGKDFSLIEFQPSENE
jgi:hypothetical protein